jgi:hypothetical protein
VIVGVVVEYNRSSVWIKTLSLLWNSPGCSSLCPVSWLLFTPLLFLAIAFLFLALYLQQKEELVPRSATEQNTSQASVTVTDCSSPQVASCVLVKTTSIQKYSSELQINSKRQSIYTNILVSMLTTPKVQSQPRCAYEHNHLHALKTFSSCQHKCYNIPKNFCHQVWKLVRIPTLINQISFKCQNF